MFIVSLWSHLSHTTALLRAPLSLVLTVLVPSAQLFSPSSSTPLPSVIAPSLVTHVRYDGGGGAHWIDGAGGFMFPSGVFFGDPVSPALPVFLPVAG